MFAVIIATPINTITAIMEVLDRDAIPLIPCPEVHPLDSRVPNPTKSPPNAILQSWTVVVQKPVGDKVNV